MVGLRKVFNITQRQSAKSLEISQQLIATYEAETWKIPASMLPPVARLFSVSREELIGKEKLWVKRGPTSILQREMEQVGSMSRAKQKFIAEMLEALIKQQKSASR